MSQRHTGNSADSNSDENDLEALERLLVEGVSLDDTSTQADQAAMGAINRPYGRDQSGSYEMETESDVQGALGLFAEATQDMATASVELGLGRHFACADFCNQAAEKAAQAVSLLRFGRRSMYDHDLRALGILVGASQEIQDEMATLTPFHPESFYADTPPEEADEVINAEQASGYVQSARRVLRWARGIVLNA